MTEATLTRLEAEHALLGAAMFDSAVMERCEDVRPEHFAEPFHGRLWALMQERARDGRSSDPTLLGGALAGDPAYAELGMPFLAELMDRAPPTSVIADFAREVRDSALARTLRDFGAEVSDRAKKGEAVEALLADAEKRLQEMASDGPTRDAWRPIAEVMDRAYAAARTRSGMAGIATGIYDLDKILRGYKASTFNLIAARPGMGKTAWLVQLVINVARQGRGVGVFSLEEPEDTLPYRFPASIAFDRMAPYFNGVSSCPTYEAFQSNELEPAQWDRLERAKGVFDTLPVHLDFRSKLKPSQILAAARRLKRRWHRAGLLDGLIIVDHLGHAAPEHFTGSRVQDTGAISGDMMHIAKATGLPVIGLCQLSRANEGREDKRPTLSDLRWAGELEQDANSVTFLYRPAYYAREPEDAEDVKGWDRFNRLKDQRFEIHFYVEKNRGGRTGMAKAFCDIGCNAIQDMDAVEVRR